MCIRPNWVEISHSRLLANYGYLRHRAGSEADLLAVVKADAYGHSLEHCAPLLADAGAEWLGVTSVEEGMRTRALCSSSGTRILVLSGLWHGEAAAAIEHNLTPVVWEPFHLEELEAAAAARGLGPQSIAVHLEIDTGMARQGVAAPVKGEQAAELKQILGRFHPGSTLRLEGVMTHFSAAESMDSVETGQQLGRLAAALEGVAAAGLRFRWLHAGASATLLGGGGMSGGGDFGAMSKLALQAGARLMLRPGLALYGYGPRFSPLGTVADAAAAQLLPVLAWKSRVVSLRSIAVGERVSYNGTFCARRPTRLALVAAGYGDGLNRLLSNRGSLLVCGQRAPIAGRICMDQTLLDVTDVPAVRIGDEVTILAGGNVDKPRAMDAYEHADLMGTIPWEVLCAIGSRVPRVLVS